MHEERLPISKERFESIGKQKPECAQPHTPFPKSTDQINISLSPRKNYLILKLSKYDHMLFRPQDSQNLGAHPSPS